MAEVKWNSRGYQKFDTNGAKEYAEIANQVFAPIYPVIARQIVDRCKIDAGLCIDVGSGPANLAVALTKITKLEIFAMDFSWDIIRMARTNTEADQFHGRVTLVVGDVQRMPFKGSVASLIISRGSMRFWRNKPVAFKEIHRVLRPGGKGYVGGGLGSSQLGEEISREMIKRGAQWKKGSMKKYRTRDVIYFQEILCKAGFVHHEIILDDSGFWLYLEKGD
jgi:ubiquinone/menaquinone biosynthesis C-methylase UbiE